MKFVIKLGERLSHIKILDKVGKVKRGVTAALNFLKCEKKGLRTLKGAGKSTKSNWHKGTFDNAVNSMEYHLKTHGKGRTIEQYTDDAMDFYHKNKNKGMEVTLKDGTKGFKVQTGKGKNKVGGYWTKNGKLVTFWD